MPVLKRPPPTQEKPQMKHSDASGLLSTDPFDVNLHDLMGLPNGAHTQPTVIQWQDDYKNTMSYMVQTVKWDAGETVFLTVVGASGVLPIKLIIPPRVLDVILRQRDSVITQVRRRHGKRIAAERKAAGINPLLDPKVREKALAARKAKAARKRTRRGR
jgi:hypothetical protein